MLVPARIGKYEIVDRIGRGGMGVVYKARDSVLGPMVAVKVMTSNLGMAVTDDQGFGGRKRRFRAVTGAVNVPCAVCTMRLAGRQSIS